MHLQLRQKQSIESRSDSCHICNWHEVRQNLQNRPSDTFYELKHRKEKHTTGDKRSKKVFYNEGIPLPLMSHSTHAHNLFLAPIPRFISFLLQMEQVSTCCSDGDDATDEFTDD